MKSNETPDPDKIYIPYVRVTFMTPRIATDKRYSDSDIEYIKTETFMKKAKEAFCKATCNGHPPRSTCTSLGTCREYDNFVKFLRGE